MVKMGAKTTSSGRSGKDIIIEGAAGHCGQGRETGITRR